LQYYKRDSHKKRGKSIRNNTYILTDIGSIYTFIFLRTASRFPLEEIGDIVADE